METFQLSSNSKGKIEQSDLIFLIRKSKDEVLQNNSKKDVAREFLTRNSINTFPLFRRSLKLKKN